MSWDIATKGLSTDSSNSNSDSESDRTLSSTVDDRTRLQALALANDCNKHKIDLVTNGVIITDAIKFVQQKKQELNQMNSDNPAISDEKEAKKRTREKEEEAIASDNDIVDSHNMKNKIF